MADRRTLIEGLNPVENIDPDLAEQFISSEKPRLAAKAADPAVEARGGMAEPAIKPSLPPSVVAAAQVPMSSPLTGVGRVPVGARVRTELAAALKRASLERQLQGIQPNSVQDILEESLELWLLKQGHLR